VGGIAVTAINGRVARLERTYQRHWLPEDEAALTLRRIEEVAGLIPTDALRLLCESPAGRSSPEQEEARRRFDLLLETGEWPV
jgi:hypothetical protein